MKVRGLAIAAWSVLAYNVGVIVWGAYVRATGSGAGCGRHWPLCNGVVLPRDPQTATMIEFTHRASSGIALVAVVALAVWAFRGRPRGSQVRLGAALSVAFILTEALLGAGLVLFRLVAENPSATRAAAGALHLANTYVLLACLALTAWWASGGEELRNPRGKLAGGFAVAVGGMIVLSMTGAVAALGDTLFPSGSLTQALHSDFSGTAHVLLRLRVLHPVLAVAVALAILVVARAAAMHDARSRTRRLAALLVLLVVLQLGVGVANVTLLAPVWLQLVHLAVSDALWITLVLLAASALSHAASARVPVTEGSALSRA